MLTRCYATAVALLCILLPFILAAVPAPEVPRRLDSDAARTLIRLLESSDWSGTAAALAYPPDYTKEDLSKDQLEVAESLRALSGHFGAVSSVRQSDRPLQFYEVGVGGGPRPFWWQSPNAPSRTFQYIYEVRFSAFGPGVIKILTFDSPNGEAPVSIYFGLLISSPESEQRLRRAFNALLDTVGLPSDHPARSMPVPYWESPPASLP